MHSNNGQAAETVKSYYTDRANVSSSRANLQANINADVCVIDDNIFFIHGYSGHGVTASHLVGKLISEVIDGHTEKFNHFNQLPFYPLPGGRWFRIPLVVIGTWWYIARDKPGI